jgi:hypothetical protein
MCLLDANGNCGGGGGGCVIDGQAIYVGCGAILAGGFASQCSQCGLQHLPDQGFVVVINWQSGDQNADASGFGYSCTSTIGYGPNGVTPGTKGSQCYVGGSMSLGDAMDWLKNNNGAPLLGLAFYPGGLPPSANPSLQAMKAATRKLFESPPQNLREVPEEPPQLRDPEFVETFEHFLHVWLNGVESTLGDFMIFMDTPDVKCVAGGGRYDYDTRTCWGASEQD